MTGASLFRHRLNLEHVLKEHIMNPPKATSWERETCKGASVYTFGEYRLNLKGEGSEHEIIIYEECNSISSRVWDNSVLTVKWLERVTEFGRKTFVEALNLYNNNDVAVDNGPLQVLELGAGTGLLSVSLAKMGATVLATEYGPAVKQLQRNCDQNGVTQKTRLAPGSVICQELDWFRTTDTLESLFNPGERDMFDVIVVTDCSLSNVESRSVIKMIHKYGTPGHTVVIVGLCQAREGTAFFIEHADQEFKKVSIVPTVDYHPDFTSSRHAIVIIQM